MFKRTSTKERLIAAENERTAMAASLAQAQADTDYIAMMTDVELPKKEGEANVSEISEG